MAEAGSIDRKIATGAALNYLGFFAGKIIVFVNTVVLARLLAPEHFGLVALGLLVLALAETLAEAGTGAAVVWHGAEAERTAPVALAVGLISAAVIVGVVWLLAPAIAGFFKEPEATGIIRALSLCALVTAPASVFSGILQKRMQFARRLVPEILKALTKGGVGIPMALLGYGAWSLVASQLAGVIVGLVIVWRLSGWSPRLSLRADILREVLPYGLHIAAVGMLGLAIKKLDVTLIGYLFDAAALGHYTLAFSLVELSVMGLVWAASQAFFPALAGSGQNPEALRRMFLKGLSRLLLLVLPMAAGLAIAAEPLILTLYGQKWAESAGLMRILACYAALYALGFNVGDVYKATGRPQILSWINAGNLLIAAPLLWAAAHWGLAGVAAGQAVLAAILSAVSWALARRFSGLDPAVLWQALRGPLAATLAMTALCLLADRLWLEPAPPPLRLLGLAGIGLATYAALVLGWLKLRRPRQVTAS